LADKIERRNRALGKKQVLMKGKINAANEI